MSGLQRPGAPDPDLALDDLTSPHPGRAEDAERAHTLLDYTRHVSRLRVALFGLAAVVAVPALLAATSGAAVVDTGRTVAAQLPDGYDADGVRLSPLDGEIPASAPPTVPGAAPEAAPSAPTGAAGTTQLRADPAAPPDAAPPQDATGAWISPDWLARVGGLTGVPERALRGYAGAQLAMERENPACGASWVTLAAIGSVETRHGTWGGGEIGPDGVTTEPVIGIALDGTGGTAAIADTDGGRLDGDTTWDRAVGPMQFIPSTWERWAADGDGDGTENPHDIDDAALAAARYLCANDRDLTDGDQWWQAVRSYNSSDAYVSDVYDEAQHYATRSD